MMAPIAASLIAPTASSLIQPVASSLINADWKRTHESKKSIRMQISSIISIAFNDKNSGKRIYKSRKRT